MKGGGKRLQDYQKSLSPKVEGKLDHIVQFLIQCINPAWKFCANNQLEKKNEAGESILRFSLLS